MRKLGDILSFLVSLGIVYFLLFAFYPPSRLWPLYLLEVDDHPKKGADAVVLLMGDLVDRTPEAARLWREGYAKRIIFAESEEDAIARLGLIPRYGELSYRYLTEKLDVTASDIIFLSSTRVTSTKEEAEAVFEALERDYPEIKRIILTTSWYHSRRAAWVFSRVNKGRWTVESSPSPHSETWYKEERNFLFVFNEFLKWPHNVLKYGLF